jgi:phage shock protein PspC (stress-responsive transcriptional regulator)
MVNPPTRADDPSMTTEQPTAPRILRRRSSDRVIGGVASGLGDYFNVDPLLIRIGFVGLMVFGGSGIFLYLAAWLLMPDETTGRSITQRILDRVGLGGGFFATVLIVLGGIVLINVLGNVADRSGGVPAVVFALAVIAAGALVLRRGDADDGSDVAAVAPANATTEMPAAPVLPTRTVVLRPSRPPSPLGWYVLGGALVGGGLLAAGANAMGTDVHPGRYFGLVLGVIGAGLLIGTRWGHARWLILIGVLLLPLAFGASMIRVPIEGGWGAYGFTPTSRAEVRDEYRLAGGEMLLDLTEVGTGDDPVVIAASVAIGELFVLLPDDADVELNAAVGGGGFRILDDRQSGAALKERYVVDGDGTTFFLELEVGLGVVRVETQQAEGR